MPARGLSQHTIFRPLTFATTNGELASRRRNKGAFQPGSVGNFFSSCTYHSGTRSSHLHHPVLDVFAYRVHRLLEWDLVIERKQGHIQPSADVHIHLRWSPRSQFTDGMLGFRCELHEHDDVVACSKCSPREIKGETRYVLVLLHFK